MSKLACLTLLAAATVLSATVGAQDLAGKMGEIELRSADLKQIIDAQTPEVRRQLAADLSALERLARNELMRRAALAEARQKGWDKKAELQPAIERARDQIVIAAYLASLTRPPEGFPSEEELKTFYEANQSQLMAPAQYQISRIFVAAADDADKAVQGEALKKITDLSARLARPGADFAKLAKENSVLAESAEKGGGIGWVTEAQMVPEIRRAVRGMGKGDISAPIKSPGGWHLVKLEDMKPPVLRPLPDVRATLTNVMRQRKTQELERAYLEEVTGRMPPTLNQIELNKLQSGIR